MNATYYYSNGTAQFGPFAVEQLRQEPVNAETMIWRAGLPTWQKAGELNEFSTWFAPPPLPAGQLLPNTPERRSQPEHNTPYGLSAAPLKPMAKNRPFLFWILGGGILLLILANLPNPTDGEKAVAENFASVFTARFMKEKYPFTGRDPSYQMTDWSFDEGVYAIDLRTNWLGSCFIIDDPCNVGYSVRLRVSEQGKVLDYHITNRNGCATGHQLCEIVIDGIKDEYLH